MPKKVKTFTVDEEAYDQLVSLIKENEASTSVSYCLNRYIKEMLAYVLAVKEGLEDSGSYTVPMSFIIESVANIPNFKALSREPATGKRKSSLQAELEEWQDKYAQKLGKELKLTIDPEVYGEISEAAKKYGVKDIVTFLFKGMLERVKKGSELTDDDYRALVKSMGEGFDEYRKGKVIPKLDKIDDKLDKVLKPFGLKVDRKDKQGV